MRLLAFKNKQWKTSKTKNESIEKPEKVCEIKQKSLQNKLKINKMPYF